MAPGRVKNTISLARELGVMDRLDDSGPAAVRSTSALLQTVHTADYIAAVFSGARTERPGHGSAPATTRSFRACMRSRLAS